jgi:hypothetical protein
MQEAINYLQKRLNGEESIHREYMKLNDRKMAKVHRDNADSIDFVIQILKDKNNDN